MFQHGYMILNALHAIHCYTYWIYVYLHKHLSYCCTTYLKTCNSKYIRQSLYHMDASHHKMRFKVTFRRHRARMEELLLCAFSALCVDLVHGAPKLFPSVCLQLPWPWCVCRPSPRRCLRYVTEINLPAIASFWPCTVMACSLYGL